MLYQLSYASAAKTTLRKQMRYKNCKGPSPISGTLMASSVENRSLRIQLYARYPAYHLHFSRNSDLLSRPRIKAHVPVVHSVAWGADFRVAKRIPMGQ